MSTEFLTVIPSSCCLPCGPCSCSDSLSYPVCMSLIVLSPTGVRCLIIISNICVTILHQVYVTNPLLIVRCKILIVHYLHWVILNFVWSFSIVKDPTKKLKKDATLIKKKENTEN